MSGVNELNTRLFDNRDYHAAAKNEMAKEHKREVQNLKEKQRHQIDSTNVNHSEEVADIQEGYEVKITDQNDDTAEQLRNLKNAQNIKSTNLKGMHAKDISDLKKTHRDNLDSNRSDFDSNIFSKEQRLISHNAKAQQNYLKDINEAHSRSEQMEVGLKDTFAQDMKKTKQEMRDQLEELKHDYDKKITVDKAQSAETLNKEKIRLIADSNRKGNDSSITNQRQKEILSGRLQFSEREKQRELEGITDKSNKRLNSMQSTFINEKKSIIKHTRKQMDQFNDKVKSNFAQKYDRVTDDFSKRLYQKDIEGQNLREQYRNKTDAIERAAVQQIKEYQISSDRTVEVERNAMQLKIKAERREHEMRLNKERVAHSTESARMKNESSKRMTDVIGRYEEKLRADNSSHISEIQKLKTAQSTRVRTLVDEGNDEKRDLISVYEDRLDGLRDKNRSTSIKKSVTA